MERHQEKGKKMGVKGGDVRNEEEQTKEGRGEEMRGEEEER